MQQFADQVVSHFHLTGCKYCHLGKFTRSCMGLYNKNKNALHLPACSYMQSAVQTYVWKKAVVVPWPLSQNPLCLALSHGKSLGSRLEVGGMPPISGDPLPHGLCSSPSSQRGSAPGGRCIPCHKSTFLHNRDTENGPQHSGSPWVGSRLP